MAQTKEKNKMAFNPSVFKQHFPYLQQADAVVYLDSAATALKPQVLTDATIAFYQSAGSVHRSQYDEKQTALFEQARENVKTSLVQNLKKRLFGHRGQRMLSIALQEGYLINCILKLKLSLAKRTIMLILLLGLKSRVNMAQPCIFYRLMSNG